MEMKSILNTKLEVSPLGLGTLTMGPFQKNLPLERGAALITDAVRRGINLIDTADLYETYPYIKKALERLTRPERENLLIMSRSYDYTYDGMKKSFEKACREMGVGRISIFMLHEMESELTLKGHDPGLRYLLEMKDRGLIDLTGISTHYIRAVRAAADRRDIDCIFAILNCRGLGIMDGTAGEMEDALCKAHQKGKVIFIMKALGGGHLFREASDALAYVRDLPFVDSVVVGMQSVEEIDFNISVVRSAERGGRKADRATGMSPVPEVRSRKPEDGGRMTEGGGRKADVGRKGIEKGAIFRKAPQFIVVKKKGNTTCAPSPYNDPTFSKVSGRMTEGGGRKSDVRCQKSEWEEGSWINNVRMLIIEDYCRGCGRCMNVCPYDAISIRDGRAIVNREKCILCSYCAYVCPDFCIKII